MQRFLLAQRRTFRVIAQNTSFRSSAPARTIAVATILASPSTRSYAAATSKSSIPPHWHRKSRAISSSTKNTSSPASATAAAPLDHEEPRAPPKQRHETPTLASKPEHYSIFPKTLPLGPPPAGPFKINLTSLKREFLSLQARAHPDLARADEKSRAQALSASINEAYKVLSSPLLRAQYLLSLRLGPEASGLGEEGKTDNPELLMEVMEAHHAVEDATSETELEVVRRENEERIEESELRLAGHFEGDDIKRAREEAVKLKYWIALREKIHEWEVPEGRRVH